MDVGTELANSKLFEGLRAEDLAAIVAIAQPVQFTAMQTIFRAGEAGDCLYVIVEGTVVVKTQDDNGDEVDVAHLSSGSCFGEMEVVGGMTRAASIVAETDGRGYRFIGNALIDVLGRSDRLAAQIYRRLCVELIRRLRNSTRDMGYFKARAH